MRFRRGHGQLAVPTQQTVRVIKGGGLTALHVQERNDKEDAAFAGTQPEFYNEENDVPAFFAALSALDQARFLYLPPFLSLSEINNRRFGKIPSDRWWEWEKELGLTSADGRPRLSVD